MTLAPLRYGRIEDDFIEVGELRVMRGETVWIRPFYQYGYSDDEPEWEAQYSGFIEWRQYLPESERVRTPIWAVSAIERNHLILTDIGSIRQRRPIPPGSADQEARDRKGQSGADPVEAPGEPYGVGRAVRADQGADGETEHGQRE